MGPWGLTHFGHPVPSHPIPAATVGEFLIKEKQLIVTATPAQGELPAQPSMGSVAHPILFQADVSPRLQSPRVPSCR